MNDVADCWCAHSFAQMKWDWITKDWMRCSNTTNTLMLSPVMLLRIWGQNDWMLCQRTCLPSLSKGWPWRCFIWWLATMLLIGQQRTSNLSFRIWSTQKKWQILTARVPLAELCLLLLHKRMVFCCHDEEWCIRLHDIAHPWKGQSIEPQSTCCQCQQLCLWFWHECQDIVCRSHWSDNDIPTFKGHSATSVAFEIRGWTEQQMLSQNVISWHEGHRQREWVHCLQFPLKMPLGMTVCTNDRNCILWHHCKELKFKVEWALRPAHKWRCLHWQKCETPWLRDGGAGGSTGLIKDRKQWEQELCL